MSKKNYVLEALQKSLAEYQKLHDDLEINLNTNYCFSTHITDIRELNRKYKANEISLNEFEKSLKKLNKDFEKKKALYFEYHGEKYLDYLHLSFEYKRAISSLNSEIYMIKNYVKYTALGELLQLDN